MRAGKWSQHTEVQLAVGGYRVLRRIIIRLRLRIGILALMGDWLSDN
jgi:hypothetical protein